MEKETKEENIDVTEEIREDIINIEETKVEENSKFKEAEVEDALKENIIVEEKKKLKEIDEESVKTASKIIIWLTIIGVGLTIFTITTILILVLKQDIFK